MMVSSKSWIVALLALVLSACDGGFDQSGGDNSGGDNDDGGSGTGGETVTDEGVSLALGTGAGSSFNSGTLSLSSSNLAAGGSSTVTVNLVDTNENNALYEGVPVTVQFSSGCAASEKASFSSDSVVTSGGTVEVNYTAAGCLGEDTITARVDQAIASATVTVNPADVGAIGFQSVEFPSIAYSGFWREGLPSITAVYFALRDGDGNIVQGQDVAFSLTSRVIGEGQPTLVAASATSDENGVVAARVRAGTIGTSVRVVASHTLDDGSIISTTSSAIAVNTGPAHYEDFKVYSDTYAPEAFNYVETINLTAYASDKNQNPVADGTPISFWTEYGQIGATCETVDGRCSVEWNSSGELSASSGPTGLIADGLTTIQAWTAGEDSFYDSGTDGINGLFDSTDTLIDIPERFYDRTFDGVWNSGVEEYIDYDGSSNYTPTSTEFRGYSCSDSAIVDGHCSQGVEVWDDLQVVMATSGLNLVPSATTVQGSGTFTVSISDGFGHQPPAGTSISVDADNGEVELVGGNTVLDGGSLSPVEFTVKYKDDKEAPLSGTILITATTPKGVESVTTVTILDDYMIITPSTFSVTGTTNFTVDVTMASGGPAPDFTALTVETSNGTATFAGGAETDYVINGNSTLTVEYVSDGAAPTRGFIQISASSPDEYTGSAFVEAMD